MADEPKGEARRPRDPALENATWKPPHWDPADVTAVKACAEGRASPEQQKRAMAYIVNTICGMQDWAYRPGVNDRDTNIGLGFATKGTGVQSFYTNSTAKQVEIAHVASAVNWLKFSGSATGVLSRIEPEGSDTNAGLLITGKGTGRVAWNVSHISAGATAGTNGAPPAQVSGYLQMLLSPNVAIRVPYYNA